jgi:hypothetical protein
MSDRYNEGLERARGITLAEVRRAGSPPAPPLRVWVMGVLGSLTSTGYTSPSW